MNNLLFTTVDSGGQLKVPKLNVGVIFAGLVLSTLVYLTALQWNAAFSLSIENLQTKHKELNEEEAAYVVAGAVTVSVVIITLIVYFALRSRARKTGQTSMTGMSAL
jgi:uncharacterized membrane protein